MTQNEMSNSAETNTPRLPNVGLPGAGGFKLGTDPAPDDAEGESNAVFGSLVTGDSDIVGLVAYSIYKQNKHDWLIAYNKAVGRKPNDAELNAYIIGESTPRRLATYRHLAEATLEGRGPTTPAGPTGEGFTQRNYAVAARHMPRTTGPASGPNWSVVGVVGLAVLGAIGIYLAARYGFNGATKP